MDKKLFNQKWLKVNEEKLQQLFPDKLTPCAEMDTIKLAVGLRLIGVSIKDENEIYTIMSHLRNIGILNIIGTMFIRGSLINREDLMRAQDDDSYWVRLLLKVRRGIVRLIH